MKKYETANTKQNRIDLINAHSDALNYKIHILLYLLNLFKINNNEKRRSKIGGKQITVIPN